jgi:hypothetical protein
MLKYLATKLPLVLLVFSGNASLHGWFKTSGVTKEILGEFYDKAVSLGADSKMFSPCQFTRLPMGTHAATGKMQRVIYFNSSNAYYV